MPENEERFVYCINGKRAKEELFLGDISVCRCCINVENGIWSISSWYTQDGYGHKGYGKRVMKRLVKTLFAYYGEPEEIEYIWNGTNSYVFDWLNNNFGAVSRCPIAVQKYSNDDDWSSHMYKLNKEKFLTYFDVKKPTE